MGRPLRVGDARGPAGTIDAVTWGRPRGGSRCDALPRGDGRGRGTPAEGRRQGGRRGGAGDLRAGALGRRIPARGRARERDAGAGGVRQRRDAGEENAAARRPRRMRWGAVCPRGDERKKETPAEGRRRRPRRGRWGAICPRGDGREKGTPAEGRRRGECSGGAGDVRAGGVATNTGGGSRQRDAGVGDAAAAQETVRHKKRLK